MAGYAEHVGCLADVKDAQKNAKLDCFGIYPQVIRLAHDWVMGERALQNSYKKKMSTETHADLIYLGWIQHLYVHVFLCHAVNLSVNKPPKGHWRSAGFSRSGWHNFAARRQCVGAAFAMATWLSVCLSVCLSRRCIVPKRLSQSSCDIYRILAQPF